MCQHVTNIYFPAIEINRSDQSVIVSTNIEYGQVTNFVHQGESVPQLYKNPRTLPEQQFYTNVAASFLNRDAAARIALVLCAR